VQEYLLYSEPRSKFILFPRRAWLLSFMTLPFAFPPRAAVLVWHAACSPFDTTNAPDAKGDTHEMGHGHGNRRDARRL
jgi:hypothetical protein